MTQDQLGQAINFSKSTVAMVETGQRMPRQDLTVAGRVLVRDSTRPGPVLSLDGGSFRAFVTGVADGTVTVR